MKFYLRKLANIIASIFIICLVNNLNGQSISNLDAANGFKDFKIGDPLSKWSGKVYKSGSEAGQYRYSGDAYKTVFGCNIRDIDLLFDKSNRLVSIVPILKEKWNSYGVSTMIQSAEKSFGICNGKHVENGSVFYLWATSKLAFAIIVSPANANGLSNISISFSDKQFISQYLSTDRKDDY
jgi:hypothetical protein